MLINIKAQVEVKVRKGSKGEASTAMIDQLGEAMDRLLQEFIASRGQDSSLYSFEVKEGITLTKY
jgi:hypothetical protein